MYGNYLAIGSPGSLLSFHNSLGEAKVYVFQKENAAIQWNLKQIIFLEPGANNSNFGTSIAFSSTFLLIGDSLDNSAHLFLFTNEKWILLQNLVPEHQVFILKENN